jgi:hypothetical protein
MRAPEGSDDRLTALPGRSPVLDAPQLGVLRRYGANATWLLATCSSPMARPTPSAWPPAECSHVADTSPPARRQMLVDMNAATAGGGARLLADGHQVPVLGLGTCQVPDGRECW